MDCYYINLDVAEDRKLRLEENFAARKRPGWTLTRFPAVDKTYVERNDVPGTSNPGQKGCYLSHQFLMSERLADDKSYFILEDDAAFVAELARVTKPGGRLVVNTPQLKRTLLRRLRQRLGQTDEKHGHLRPGYTLERLQELLRPAFELERQRSYSRFFSEALDTALNWGMERLGKRSSAKGMVVTQQDLARHRKLFRAYGAVYPLLWSATRLDALVPASGYMLIVSLRRRDS